LRQAQPLPRLESKLLVQLVVEVVPGPARRALAAAIAGWAVADDAGGGAALAACARAEGCSRVVRTIGVRLVWLMSGVSIRAASLAGPAT